MGLMTQLARRHDLTAVMLVDDEFRRRRVPPGHAGLLPRRRAGPQPLRSGRPRPNGCCSCGPSPRSGASSGCGSRCQRCSRRWTGSCAPGGSTSSTWSSRISATTTCARLRPASSSRAWSWTRTRSPTTWRGSSPAPAASLGRRLYAGANWRKLRREELGTYRDADGVYLCSADDERRLLDQLPDVRTAVIPNAADVEYYQPRPTDPPPDGRTVVYFGLLSTVPNIDGVIHFVQQYLAPHRRGAPRGALQDHRRPAAAVAAWRWRGPGSS